MYLEAKKNRGRHRRTYLEILKLQQRYGWCLQGETTTPKVYGTFPAVKNKQYRVFRVFRV